MIASRMVGQLAALFERKVFVHDVAIRSQHWLIVVAGVKFSTAIKSSEATKASRHSFGPEWSIGLHFFIFCFIFFEF